MIVITGEGKGKSTAALGMAVRAAGWKKRCVIIHFLKPKKSGEGFIKIPYVKQYWFGHKTFVTKPCKKDYEIVKRAMDVAKKEAKKKPFLLILDEVTHAVNLGLVNVDDIIKLDKKTEVVVTGRNAPKELVEKAELVSEIKNTKHPFSIGKKARKGLEY